MDAAGNIVLEVQGLCFGYPDRPLLDRWNAQIRGGVSLVVGGDGAGKTTLLRLLAGVLPDQGGQWCLSGAELRPHTPEYQAQVYWAEPRSAGMDQVVPAAWWAELPARYPNWCVQDLARHIEGFGLAPHMHKPMYQLSTGSQRKVLMAAGLACGAALTLLDEPVAGLDKPSIRYLQHALAAEAGRDRHRAIVVAHYEVLPDVPWRDTWVLQD